jgi:Mn-dependent DtxR family transcriptional regulator
MADGTSTAAARQLLMGFRGTHLLYVMAELGVADQLVGGPRRSVDLASELGAHPDALHRVLRALAQLGVLDQRVDGRFALTPIGDCLRSDRVDSLRPVARF